MENGIFVQRAYLVISIPMLTVRCHRDHPETVIIFEIIHVREACFSVCFAFSNSVFYFARNGFFIFYPNRNCVYDWGCARFFAHELWMKAKGVCLFFRRRVRGVVHLI